MELSVTKPSDDLAIIRLAGRLDAAGADSVGLKLTAEAASRRLSVVLDLSGIDFLASIGIRLLLTVARAQKQRGGKVVLLAPQPLVRDVLTSTGCDTLIGIYDDLDAASAAASQA